MVRRRPRTADGFVKFLQKNWAELYRIARLAPVIKNRTPLSEMSEDPKEQQILAAARQEFPERGYYARTSMDNVARRACTSKTTLYTRFSSKEALFAATIAAECRSSGVAFAAEELDGLSVEAALRRIGTRFVILLSSPEAVRIEQVVAGETARFPEVAENFVREGVNPTPPWPA